MLNDKMNKQQPAAHTALIGNRYSVCSEMFMRKPNELKGKRKKKKNS